MYIMRHLDRNERKTPGPQFLIKMSSHQYQNSIVQIRQLSYFHHGVSHAGETTPFIESVEAYSLGHIFTTISRRNVFALASPPIKPVHRLQHKSLYFRLWRWLQLLTYSITLRNKKDSCISYNFPVLPQVLETTPRGKQYYGAAKTVAADYLLFRNIAASAPERSIEDPFY